MTQFFNYAKSTGDSGTSGSSPRRVSADHSSRYTPNGAFSAGTNTNSQSRLRKHSKYGGRSVEIIYQTMTGIGEGTTAGDGSAWTISASLEYPAGTFYRAVAAADGISTSITVTPGSGVLAKFVVPGIDIPADADYWIRSRATYAATGAVISGITTDGVTEWTKTTTGTADYTMTDVGAPAFNSAAAFNPAVVTMIPFTALPNVGLCGDSITAGTGDGTSGGVASAGPGGWAVRALSADGQTGRSLPLIPCVQQGEPSETAANWATPLARRQRLAVFDSAQISNVWVLLGTNDVGVGNLATVQANLISIWTLFHNRGVRVFGHTLPPKTTSTDSWATTQNQTPFSSEATRVALNRWLRDGAPMLPSGTPALTGSTSGGVLRAGQSGHPLYLVSDIGGAVETAQDSGLWLANGTANAYTPDGFHPSALGAPLMAAVAYAHNVPNLLTPSA